jgi:hypothetical protein
MRWSSKNLSTEPYNCGKRLALRSSFVLIIMSECSELSFKVVRLEHGGQELVDAPATLASRGLHSIAASRYGLRRGSSCGSLQRLVGHIVGENVFVSLVEVGGVIIHGQVVPLAQERADQP